LPRWLVIEDLNESPQRLDRYLAHLTLAEAWQEFEGLIVGDFHKGDVNLTDALLALLPYHLRSHNKMPVMTCRQIGHVWPMSPVPIHHGVTFKQNGQGCFHIDCRWPDFIR